jgi:tetratricopeptide (TPR) repeat protein
MNCDLELEITAGDTPGLYIITVDSPAGAASGQLRLNVEELLSRRRELASAVLVSAVPTRSRLSAQELSVREVGQQLFEAVFADRVYGRYTASVQEAARRGEPLRVVLRLRAQELAALPWEAMFDPEADEYLCQREPIVRYVETAQPATPLPVDPPLRILGLVSAPRDLPELDVDEERRRLTDAIDDLGRRRQVELTWASKGTWPCMQEALLDGHWHVLHFIGHGGIDRDVGVLALENEAGRANLVSSARFARLLHACRPVPRLVVLNSCQSGEAAVGDLLSSTAASLVHSGISAAVAMQFAVTDPAALAFSRGFYQALAHNQPVDEAVRLGRIAIDGTSEHTLEWVTPVLFLRTDETRLFAIRGPDSGASSPSGQPPPEQAERESTLNGLYMQALAAMRTGRPADAITLLDSLLALEPGYKDAAKRRDAARLSQRSAASYQRGRAAEGAGNWDSAVAEYTAVTDTDPDYRDVSARLAYCGKHQQIARLQEELRIHVRASEWEAVIAVGDELTGLGVRSAEVDRAVKTARQRARRAEEANRAGSEQLERDGQAARLAAVAGGLTRRKQQVEEADTGRGQDTSSRTGGEWRIFYASHFPILGLIMITVPLFILVIFSLHIATFTTMTPFWIITILGLAGVAGSAIDYRNGCGVSAVAVGINSIWLSGYAIFWLEAVSQHLLTNVNDLLLFVAVIAGIGFIANGILLIYIFRSRALRRRIIDAALLVFLIFMASGLAVLSVSSALISGPLLPWLERAAGVMFLGALLTELTGIVFAFIRAKPLAANQLLKSMLAHASRRYTPLPVKVEDLYGAGGGDVSGFGCSVDGVEDVAVCRDA